MSDKIEPILYTILLTPAAYDVLATVHKFAGYDDEIAFISNIVADAAHRLRGIAALIKLRDSLMLLKNGDSLTSGFTYGKKIAEMLDEITQQDVEKVVNTFKETNSFDEGLGKKEETPEWVNDLFKKDKPDGLDKSV